MALPVSYNVRNVFVRWRSTLATILGIALVVAVFVLVQSLAIGLRKTSANTGDPRNLMIVRKGSTAESVSQVTREQLRYLQYMEEIARDAQGQPLVSADTLVLVNLPRVEDKGAANVLLRGISPRGKELRPQVSLVDGRWFERGKREVVVSRRLGGRFQNFHIGGQFTTAGATFTVVGWMEGGKSAFDSEVWMDADEARKIFGRENYSSVLVRPVDEPAAMRLKVKLENSRQIAARVWRETEYYADQTKMALPIQVVGNFLAVAMSIGAVFAAMNTMYASVGARTREVGTLRVLGFRRRSILVSFLLEGAFLAFLGGCLGCAFAMPMNGYAASVIGFETFSEMMFEFRITPELVAQGLIFSVIVGLIGSLLPAVRASRLPVISALKSV
ncbi:MAG: ABC transporter permease [Verrucomicrobiota bacterium]